jgi:hypothetical protein
MSLKGIHEPRNPAAGTFSFSTISVLDSPAVAISHRFRLRL